MISTEGWSPGDEFVTLSFGTTGTVKQLEGVQHLPLDWQKDVFSAAQGRWVRNIEVDLMNMEEEGLWELIQKETVRVTESRCKNHTTGDVPMLQNILIDGPCQYPIRGELQEGEGGPIQEAKEQDIREGEAGPSCRHDGSEGTEVGDVDGGGVGGEVLYGESSGYVSQTGLSDQVGGGEEGSEMGGGLLQLRSLVHETHTHLDQHLELDSLRNDPRWAMQSMQGDLCGGGGEPGHREVGPYLQAGGGEQESEGRTGKEGDEKYDASGSSIGDPNCGTDLLLEKREEKKEEKTEQGR